MDLKDEKLAQSDHRKEGVRLLLGVKVWGQGTKEVKSEELRVRVAVSKGGAVPYKVWECTHL